MKHKRRVVVGLTGSIGSGKSTVAKIFRRLGAVVIDADKLVEDIYRKDQEIVRKIIKAFGDNVVGLKSPLNTKRLSQKVFASEGSIRKLNKIIHPKVLKMLKAQIKKSHGVVIVDAPLLIESGFNRFVDYIILLNCSYRLQIRRTLKKHRLSETEIRRRLQYQFPFKHKKRYADFIIDNRRSLEKLKGQVKKIYREVAK